MRNCECLCGRRKGRRSGKRRTPLSGQEDPGRLEAACLARALRFCAGMCHSIRGIAVASIAAFLFGALPATAQIVVTGQGDMNFKLGVLGQLQADTIDNPSPVPNTNNLFARRLRLLFGGQVAKNVTFFVETDAPNLGKTLAAGKNIQPSVIVQDAYAELRFADALLVDAGLMFVPFSRNSVQTAATLLPIDYGTYTFSASAP